MARIQINDLPYDIKISKEEMKKVFGGATNEDLTRFGNLPWAGVSKTIEPDPWTGKITSPDYTMSTGTQILKIE